MTNYADKVSTLFRDGTQVQELAVRLFSGELVPSWDYQNSTMKCLERRDIPVKKLVNPTNKKVIHWKIEDIPAAYGKIARRLEDRPVGAPKGKRKPRVYNVVDEALTDASTRWLTKKLV